MKRMALLLTMLMIISAVYPAYAEEGYTDFAEAAADDLLPAEAEITDGTEITDEVEITNEVEMTDEALAEELSLMSVDTNKSVYRASDAWNESTNTDSVWRWLYRDNQTKGTANEYVEYTLKGTGNTDGYAAPIQNEDGSYDYVTKSGTATVFADVTANAGMRNALGQYWARPSVATGSEPKQSVENRIVKQFTAPKSGAVTISAEDMSGAAKIYNKTLNSDSTKNAYKGAVVSIKKKADEGDIVLFTHDFQFEPADVPANGLAVYDFKPIRTNLAEGDKLWFEISSETGGSAYAKQVFWNPVVIYNYEPESIAPESRDSVPLNQSFTLTFADELEPMTKENISISGGAGVKSFSQSGSRITVDFDGLEYDTEYSVSISGIKPKGTITELFSGFSFKTKYVFKKPAYKASDAWSESTNKDRVWRWLYKNNQTKNDAKPYVEYALKGAGNTAGFAAPIKKDDGSYDYATTSGTATVFADSTSNPGMRNALGKYWARLSVATSSEPLQSTDNRIVKEFISPESGSITISAEDMSGEAKIYNKGLNVDGNRLKGAVCRIIKKTNESDTVLFEHSFEYTAATCPTDGLGVYEFRDISAEITKGDKLWFEISGETGGSAYAKQVFWNPTVSFDAVYPNITAMSPENNTKGVALNFEQRITFDYEVAEILPSDIEIDGGAHAKAVWLENGGKTLCMTFDGLAPDTEYNAEIKNVRIASAADSAYRPYKLSFKTGTAVQFGDMYIEGGFKAGANKIVIDINNAAGAAYPYTAALMAVVCKRTETGYTVESVRTVCRNDIAENDKLSAEVSVLNTNEYFIKAVLLKSVPSAQAITELKTFSK